MQKKNIAHFVTEFLSHMGKNICSRQTQTGDFAGVQKISS